MKLLALVTVLMTPVMVPEMRQLGHPLSSQLVQLLPPSHPPSSMAARPSSTSPC